MQYREIQLSTSITLSKLEIKPCIKLDPAGWLWSNNYNKLDCIYIQSCQEGKLKKLWGLLISSAHASMEKSILGHSSFKSGRFYFFTYQVWIIFFVCYPNLLTYNELLILGTQFLLSLKPSLCYFCWWLNANRAPMTMQCHYLGRVSIVFFHTKIVP